MSLAAFWALCVGCDRCILRRFWSSTKLPASDVTSPDGIGPAVRRTPSAGTSWSLRRVLKTEPSKRWALGGKVALPWWPPPNGSACGFLTVPSRRCVRFKPSSLRPHSVGSPAISATHCPYAWRLSRKFAGRCRRVYNLSNSCQGVGRYTGYVRRIRERTS